jgi:uncharacterized membrane protein YdjX (TVP38/TMEM64 family)
MRKLLGVATTALVILAFYAAWNLNLFEHLSNHEDLVRSMRQGGWRGPLICIGIQFLQVVVFVIPGEITQVAAGYVFGAWFGFLYSVIGIMLGSAFDYTFARLVGRPMVETLVGPERLRRIDAALESPKGRSALFLLFLMPGMPKDAMSYGAGLTRWSLGEFVVVSGLARTPALFFSTLIGSQLYDRDYRSIAVTVVIGVLAVAAFFIYVRKHGKA